MAVFQKCKFRGQIAAETAAGVANFCRKITASMARSFKHRHSSLLFMRL
jgi:hypothetical protein